MAFRLSKAQLKQKGELAVALRAADVELDAAIDTANAAIEAALDPVRAAVAAYGQALADAQQFAEQTAEEFRDDYDERSDGWREGERGQAADTFIVEWEGFSPDEPDEPTLPAIERGDFGSEDAVEDFEALPEEAEC